MPFWTDLPTADILDNAKRIGGTTAVAITTFLAGRYWSRYRANREWNRKEFLNRIIVSLNIFDGNTLKIRTVREDSLDAVFLNDTVIRKVLDAAKRTTLEQPILPIPKDDRWYLLNFVLNSMAEQFAIGQVRLDAGQPVTRVEYAMFLTCELVGAERIRKVRAMLLRKDHLLNFPYAETMPNLENPWHADRIKTLRAAVALYATEPDHFITVELCI